MSWRRPRPLLVGTLLVLCGACSPPHHATATPPPSTAATSGSAAPSATPAASPALGAFYAQHPHWVRCAAGVECTTVRVPLDYAHPAARTIRLVLDRLPATDAAHRIGSLVVNPGGPGVSGLGFPSAVARKLAPDLRARLDVVGFDPRGVGLSAPVHCLSSAQLTANVAIDPAPTTATGQRALIAGAKQIATACGRANGSLLRHVGTVDAARDLDVIRASLGDHGLTYLGASYGTFLGATYAELFPRHVRALVLDGALDPALGDDALFSAQAQGFEVDLHDFEVDCNRRRYCPLGHTLSAAEAALRALSRKVSAHPVPTTDGRSVGPGLYELGLASGLYFPGVTWPQLRQAIATLQAGDGTAMAQLADFQTGRESDGSYSNQVVANNAINCIDRPASRSFADYVALATRLAKASPHFGAAAGYGNLTCAYWPVPAVDRPHRIRAAGAPPILVIGTTRDPATPYAWAVSLAHQLESGRLVTFDSDGHTGFGNGSACVDGAVDRYLETGTVPGADLRCR